MPTETKWRVTYEVPEQNFTKIFTKVLLPLHVSLNLFILFIVYVNVNATEHLAFVERQDQLDMGWN